MISYNEAIEHIHSQVNSSQIISSAIDQALNCVLAEDIIAPLDNPAFKQSAMDGYAFDYSLWNKDQSLQVNGEVQAGSDFQSIKKEVTCVRIFTGAFLPEHLDTVVMQEKVNRIGDQIFIDDPNLISGSNVRLPASHTRKGDCVLKKGTVINAPAVAFLASMGFTTIKIYDKPSVALIITGKELVSPGEDCKDEQLYECNSFGLKAALLNDGIKVERIFVCDDNADEIKSAVMESLQYNFVILTGGISVGDYDFVGPVLKDSQVKTIFHKVKQKPGKPVYFGKKNASFVFALPGNPASALVCYYLYVRPAVKKYSKHLALRTAQSVLLNDYTKKKGITLFLKGFRHEDGLEILQDQNSYQLNTFALSNCIVVLEESKTYCKKGDIVDYILL